MALPSALNIEIYNPDNLTSALFGVEIDSIETTLRDPEHGDIALKFESDDISDADTYQQLANAINALIEAGAGDPGLDGLSAQVADSRHGILLLDIHGREFGDNADAGAAVRASIVSGSISIDIEFLEIYEDESAISEFSSADRAGNRQAAFELGALESATVIGALGELDNGDWYVFTAPAPGLFNAELLALGEQSGFEIYIGDEALEVQDGETLARLSDRPLGTGSQVYFHFDSTRVSEREDYCLAISFEGTLFIDRELPLYASRMLENDGDVIPAELARIFRLYMGGLTRTPDRDGFEFYVAEVAAGRKSLSDIAADFVYSPEFVGYADIDADEEVSNYEFMLHMYQNVFGREPDPAGMQWWLSQLDEGVYSQGGAFEAMVHSDEYVGVTAATLSASALWD